MPRTMEPGDAPSRNLLLPVLPLREICLFPEASLTLVTAAAPAVKALARYLHAHADLRSFLDQQRRSKEPMAWVNLACQHLPIAATARQRLLDADAPERCVKISRGLDALLRKEQGADMLK